MSSLDDLLRDLEMQHRPTKSNILDNSLDVALAEVQQQYQAPAPQRNQTVSDRLSQMLHGLEQEANAHQLKDCETNHRICQAINQVITARRSEAEQPLDEMDLQAIAAVEKRKQAQEKYWQSRADDWLAKLDPISNEGLWFLEFAESYKSRRAAAIEYLMALE